MKTILILSAFVLVLFLSACQKEEEMKTSSMFKVTIENVMDEKDYLSSGVFNTPVGVGEAGGTGPCQAYQFSFDAGPGTKLSFATMYVMSNDLFYSPSGKGIDVFSGGTAITGDITSQVMLFDAGTEVKEEPGNGPDQPLNGGSGVGMDENGTVLEISQVDDGFDYPEVNEYILVTIENDGATSFTVTISNLAGSPTP